MKIVKPLIFRFTQLRVSQFVALKKKKKITTEYKLMICAACFLYCFVLYIKISDSLDHTRTIVVLHLCFKYKNNSTL